MIEVQCSSCHTRYRIDEQVLPDGAPTFKCSRCGHVFTLEPRRHPAPTATAAITESATPQPIAEERKPTAPSTEMPPPEPAGANGASRAATPELEPSAAIPSDAAGDTQTATADLGVRSSKRKPAATDDGDNLAFDFRDEPGPPEENAAAAAPPKPEPPSRRSEPRWEVGEDDPQDQPLRRRARFRIGNEDFSGDRELPPQPLDRELDDDLVDESAAPVYNRGVVHSSRFVLALMLFTAIAFGGLTLAIHNAPAAALQALNRIPILGPRFPIVSTPAKMVVLQQVHAGYERGRDGAPDLVIRGNAENVSSATLSAVKIGVQLQPANLAQREVYCGNNLDTRTLAQMTAHEVEFFQRLAPRNFTLAPFASCSFVAVFAQPPVNTRNFELAVTQATPAQNSESSGLASQAPRSSDDDAAP